MKLCLLSLAIVVAGCSSSSSKGGSPSPGKGNDAGADSGGTVDSGGGGNDTGAGADDAGSDGSGSQGTSPAWSAFASRGTDSRWGVPLAYASKEGAFVAFGGSQYPTNQTTPATPGTFTLSPGSGKWTKLTDVSPPAARYCGCTTYLPDQDQVLLIGGQAGGLLPAGAWTLDMATSTWTTVQGTVPDGSIGCMAAYMPGPGKAIVFGGLGAKGMSSETWLYDPAAATFSLASPSAHPPARADGIAAYDPGEGGRMLLFAGTSDEVDATGHMNDLWAFDGTNWTQLQPSGGPPSVRRVPAGGFDPARRRWVVFGGTDETSDRGDLWLLDVASLTWTQLDGTGAPSARGFASAGYDPTTDAYFVIGGFEQPSNAIASDGWKLTLQ
jgi:hypothetical protein